ncbi:type IV toxin-antitoxin system AbiEi family antitoxin domain-containing protein [Nocardioides sp. KIGAM211]|uniref:Type IV toxin-antitoxin system AbiEi family antitoxin domain-containing protein n=1 Tax=Nocardioides luti TaxID=2761101 RepID=A0A7X0VA44_9ACTN|nr:type IV toxin-antitoxin system AbiEi family antitoxin domain-containing protein [Nocardioides luti]MBB6627191.1 type IV toxin-antitoxin system AbiEi family antitoxin domain-containing protein [Nocardioides luti]
MDELARILKQQDGVVSRRQVLGTGASEPDLKRMLRRRELTPVHPGTFVEHTGPLTWQQRAWAAVLCCWPAALSHDSAVRAGEGPGRRDRDDSVIHVAVDRSRHVAAPDGVRLHRTPGFEDRVQWNLGPPRIRFEEAVLDVAAAAGSELDAVAALADACGSRRTTALRLLERLAARPRIPRRDWLTGVLRDVAEGTCSVLEHGFLDRVERPHGLPSGARQAATRLDGRRVFRDVDLPGLAMVVELDGRLFHDGTHARDRDLDRDLATAATGAATVRLSYGQVFERPCATARALAAVMTTRGWTGQLQECALCGGSGSPGEPDPPHSRDAAEVRGTLTPAQDRPAAPAAPGRGRGAGRGSGGAPTHP